MHTKEELREQAKQIRNLLQADKISEKIVVSLRTVDIYDVAEHVMLFYPLEHEIDLLPLLDDNKHFYLPKVKGDKLLVCPYKKGDELTVSKFGTKEPLTKPVDISILDLVFVPALMVDKNFHRLGYGKGFYDRFLLQKGLKAIKIVPISSLLILEELPHDELDAQFDIIVDEL
jgi:5-formyltetrahydrofolate cyclo-ligase